MDAVLALDFRHVSTNNITEFHSFMCRRVEHGECRESHQGLVPNQVNCSQLVTHLIEPQSFNANVLSKGSHVHPNGLFRHILEEPCGIN